jgi:DNA-binding CsgD family transcriptional regulator
MLGQEIVEARERFARGPQYGPVDLPRPAPRALSAAIDNVPQEDCANWFEYDGIARYVLDPQGNILRSNAAARALTKAGVIGLSGAFICPTHRNRAEFEALLGRLADQRQTHGRMLFRAGDDAWCLLDLVILPGMPGKVFAAARPARPMSAEAIEPLRAVFGLTRAETSVLSHLACGEAPKDIGRKMDMSIHTVRAHLRAICMRMGVRGINGALRLSFQLAN